MAGAALILTLSLMLAGEKGTVGPMPTTEGNAPRATVQVPSGRLARAIWRLQGGHGAKRTRAHYRVITLLGGRLTARVSN